MTAKSIRESFDAWYDAFEFRRYYCKYGPFGAAFEVWQVATLTERERCAMILERMNKSDWSPIQCAEAVRKGL